MDCSFYDLIHGPSSLLGGTACYRIDIATIFARRTPLFQQLVFSIELRLYSLEVWVSYLID